MEVNMDYKVTLEQEVLDEIAAGIVARYDRYMRNANIEKSDKKNPIVLLANDANQIQYDILRKYNSLEELAIADGRLREIRNVLERLSEDDER